jgi:uracil-DNA glycosylase
MQSLAELKEKSNGCTLCPLGTLGRTQVVYGDGDPHAGIMFIGEGPGFHEDKQGIPFVGAAGKLLNQLLESIGLNREMIYITNVVKCRPPGNRDPKPEEIEICTSAYLKDQLAIINPKVVATLGRFASSVMLGLKDVTMSKVHGQKFEKDGLTIVPIYHPAAALHSRANLVPLTDDFKKLREYLDEDNHKEPEEIKELQEVDDGLQMTEVSGVSETPAEQMGLF